MSQSVPAAPPVVERPFLTVEEAGAILGISRTLAYSLARELRARAEMTPHYFCPYRVAPPPDLGARVCSLS